MNIIISTIVPLAICILNVLAIIAVLREQARSVRINNAYHTAYRRLKEWSVSHMLHCKNIDTHEGLLKIINKDHALIVESHRKVPLFNRNTSR